MTLQIHENFVKFDHGSAIAGFRTDNNHEINLITIIGYQSITVKARLLRGTIVLYDENDGYSMRKSPKTQPAKITYSRFIKNE